MKDLLQIEPNEVEAAIKDFVRENKGREVTRIVAPTLPLLSLAPSLGKAGYVVELGDKVTTKVEHTAMACEAAFNNGKALGATDALEDLRALSPVEALRKLGKAPDHYVEPFAALAEDVFSPRGERLSRPGDMLFKLKKPNDAQDSMMAAMWAFDVPRESKKQMPGEPEKVKGSVATKHDFPSFFDFGSWKGEAKGIFTLSDELKRSIGGETLNFTPEDKFNHLASALSLMSTNVAFANIGASFVFDRLVKAGVKVDSIAAMKEVLRINAPRLRSLGIDVTFPKTPGGDFISIQPVRTANYGPVAPLGRTFVESVTARYGDGPEFPIFEREYGLDSQGRYGRSDPHVADILHSCQQAAAAMGRPEDAEHLLRSVTNLMRGPKPPLVPSDLGVSFGANISGMINEMSKAQAKMQAPFVKENVLRALEDLAADGPFHGTTRELKNLLEDTSGIEFSSFRQMSNYLRDLEEDLRARDVLIMWRDTESGVYWVLAQSPTEDNDKTEDEEDITDEAVAFFTTRIKSGESFLSGVSRIMAEVTRVEKIVADNRVLFGFRGVSALEGAAGALEILADDLKKQQAKPKADPWKPGADTGDSSRSTEYARR